MGVRHNIRVWKAYLELHIKSQLEYRMNFFIQSLFMFLNDALYIIIFFIIFSQFNSINGFSFSDMALLYGLSAMSVGLLGFFAGNTMQLANEVMQGKIDFYLSQPVNPLFNITISAMDADALGDILFGLGVICIARPDQILLCIIVSIMGAITFTSFSIITGSMAFYLERPKRLSRNLLVASMGLATWPIGLVNKSARVLLFVTLLAFISLVPYEVVSNFTWEHLTYLLAGCLTSLFLAIIVFNAGLRRYESGNLVNMRG